MPVDFLARLLVAHRKTIGTPSGSRALGPLHQTVLVVRWFRDHDRVHRLARDAGISQAKGSRTPVGSPRSRVRLVRNSSGGGHRRAAHRFTGRSSAIQSVR